MGGRREEGRFTDYKPWWDSLFTPYHPSLPPFLPSSFPASLLLPQHSPPPSFYSSNQR
jgi:hypothetical protein